MQPGGNPRNIRAKTLKALEGDRVPTSRIRQIPIYHPNQLPSILFPSPDPLNSTVEMADTLTDDLTPKFAPFLGMAGVAFAMIFGCRISQCLAYL